MKRLTQIFQALLGVAALILTALIAAGRLAWHTIRNWWKNRSKWLRRSIATIFILIPVGFVALVAYALYDDAYGRDYWDRKLSDNVTLRSFSDNKWRVYDNRTEEYTTEKINWLSEAPENDSLAVYALPNKRGYINVNTGRIVIDAEANNYCKAWVFSEGLAAVMKDGKIGFINANNEVVIPFQFHCADTCILNGMEYLFHDGYCIMISDNNKFGLIDRTGRWVVKPLYDKIWTPDNGCRTIIRSDINGKKYGLLDPSCNFIYEAVYDWIGHCDQTDGYILMKDGRMWQEDSLGNIVQPFMYESSEILSYPIDWGDEDSEYTYVLSYYSKYEISGKYGILNRITGEPITLAIYDYDISMISPSLFEVSPANCYGYYVIDTKGDVISQREL